MKTKTTPDGKIYKVDRIVKEVSMDQAMAVAMSREACEAACRACPRYGKAWSCPPFGRYDFRGLHPEQFDTLRLVVTRIEPSEPISMDKGNDIFRAEKRLLMPYLYERARQKDGTVYGFAGNCDLCPGDCPRITGGPCRHPEMAGPSLEAAGFDISRLLEEYFGLDLVWSDDSFAPRIMTYMAAVAYINK